ncbi:MAG: hypothetical protein ACRETD_10010 [Steroidobacteraceae bacterium]
MLYRHAFPSARSICLARERNHSVIISVSASEEKLSAQKDSIAGSRPEFAKSPPVINEPIQMKLE